MAKFVATKLGRKEFPSGLQPADFTYKGRPADGQGDFGRDVGVADMVCVNQFGDANNNKYYHAGVVQTSGGKWYVYLEWGRQFSGNSWEGGFNGQDFQFVSCPSEHDARAFFQDQCESKNLKRLEEKKIGTKSLWASRMDSKGKSMDGYLVQRLATRSRGLPDAYSIKDSTGVVAAPVAVTPTPTVSVPTKAFQPQVVSLAQALVGGTKDYTRAAIKATSVTPTQAAIDEVRNDCIPAALQLLAKIGPDVNAQLNDTKLQDLSKYVASIVPRPIPRTGDAMAILLTSGNILAIQQDLDAFESALKGEDFSVDTVKPAVNPDSMLNAEFKWLPDSDPKGKWVRGAFLSMTNHRHGYLHGNAKILNVFEVSRPDRDAQFFAAVKRVAAVRKGRFSLRANLQPRREDLEPQYSDDYAQSNVIFAIHGTRSVNIAPITQTHFRLPKQLRGVPIAGANFGHGTYFATDYKKSVGYTSYERSYYGGGGGAIAGRGAFMFLCDMLMGEAYRAPSTGSWDTPPNGCDSVFGVGGDKGHRLENDEYVTFDPPYSRIRYLVEFTF